MSRVEIHARGSHVVVDHDSPDLSYLIDKAMAAWQSTAQRGGDTGSGVGFTSERRDADKGPGR